jgi:hypothetical protein
VAEAYHTPTNIRACVMNAGPAMPQTPPPFLC